MPSTTEREAPAAPEGRPAKMLRFEEVKPAAGTPAPTATAATTPAADSSAAQEAKKENGCSNSNTNSNSRNGNSSGSNSSDDGAAGPVKEDLASASPRASTTGSCDSSKCNKDAVDAAWAETEHRNWIVNTKVLYDVVMAIPLDWPSLTVQWLPGTTP